MSFWGRFLNKQNKNILLHLSLISGVGPVCVLKIIKKLFDDFTTSQKNPQISNQGFDLSQLYNFKVKNFIHQFVLKENIAQLLVDGLKDKKLFEKELELIEKYKVNLLTFLDSEYPQNLKEIYSPPIVLYCKGAGLSVFDKNIAIVGARKANSYAKQVIKQIVPELVSNGYKIISGGACGVDSMAHQATIDCGGKTIVVFGAGLMHPYPENNKNLFRDVIKKGGMLLSPFPFQMPPDRGNFPARNRIIAGLSSGCLIVQAAQKSGALITAKFALDEGRQVFAIPGDVNDKLSFGCHYLIKQGAKLVNCVEDILEEFGEVNSCVIKEVKKEKKKKSVKIIEQNPILSILPSSSSIDELVVKTGFSLQELQDKLFELQLEGKVKQNFAGFWEKV